MDDHAAGPAARARRPGRREGARRARSGRTPRRSAQRDRLRARARRRLPLQTLVAVGCGVATVPADDPLLLGRRRRPGRARGGPLAGPPALPGAGAAAGPARAARPSRCRRRPRSAAFPAVRRLEAVREELRRLLPLVAPAGQEAAEEAWQAAAEADTALRWQAARLAAVEPHRGAEPELLRDAGGGRRVPGAAGRRRRRPRGGQRRPAGRQPAAGRHRRACTAWPQGLREVR